MDFIRIDIKFVENVLMKDALNAKMTLIIAVFLSKKLMINE